MSLFSLLCNLYPRYTLHPIPKVLFIRYPRYILTLVYTKGHSYTLHPIPKGHSYTVHSSAYTHGNLLHSSPYNPRDTPTLFTLYGYTQGTLRHSSPYTVTLSLQASYTIQYPPYNRATCTLFILFPSYMNTHIVL